MIGEQAATGTPGVTTAAVSHYNRSFFTTNTHLYMQIHKLLH